MAEHSSDITPEEATAQEEDAPGNGASESERVEGGTPGNGQGEPERVREEAAGIGDPGSAAVSAPAHPGDVVLTREPPPPGHGPLVLADERGKPDPAAPGASRRARSSRPQRPRARKRSAAERHRAVFFARLNELRREDHAANQEGATAHGTGAPPAEDAQQPVAAEHSALGASAGEADGPPAPDRASPPPVSQARIAAAIERVGGPEVLEEALRPKADDQGERKKWALVCCEAAQGRQPGDPEFTAWLRLAATPVREIKGYLPVREERPAGGGRRGGERRGERGPGGERARRGRSARGAERGGREEGVSRQELEAFARGGTLSSKVRIVDPAAEKRERERQRKEDRERKRRAERERLSRLGY